MPRSGPGPVTSASHILTLPVRRLLEAADRGAAGWTCRSRRRRSGRRTGPCRCVSDVSLSASISSAPVRKRLGHARRWSRCRRPSRMMLRAPAQQAPAEPLHELVGHEPGDADDDHAGDDDLGARELRPSMMMEPSPVGTPVISPTTIRIQAKPDARAQPGEDAGQRGRQHHLGGTSPSPRQPSMLAASNRRGSTERTPKMVLSRIG